MSNGLPPGRYCERAVALRRNFDPASFQWERHGKVYLLVGCPTGKWRPRRKTCRTAMYTYRLVAPARGKRKCPIGMRRVRLAPQAPSVASWRR
jgi:hypothetical protein